MSLIGKFDVDQTLPVPEFPSRNGPQRLIAAATKQPKRRQKVILEPGHSPLDWARLKSSGKDLRVRCSCRCCLIIKWQRITDFFSALAGRTAVREVHVRRLKTAQDRARCMDCYSGQSLQHDTLFKVPSRRC